MGKQLQLLTAALQIKEGRAHCGGHQPDVPVSDLMPSTVW